MPHPIVRAARTARVGPPAGGWEASGSAANSLAGAKLVWARKQEQVVSTRIRSMGRNSLGLALVLGLVTSGVACADPEEEEFVGAPGVPPLQSEAEPGADPALGVERFLAELEERTGYQQTGHVETVDGVTTVWVHVDPEHQDWVAERLDGADLESLRVVAVQPVGANGSLAADARRFSTDEITGYRDSVVELVTRLGAELAEGQAEDPDSYPTDAAIEVIYGRADDQLTVLVAASFDRLPSAAAAELRELVPAEVLDLRLDAEE